MTVSEFINKVGFKINDSDVNKVNNTISDIKKTATQLLGAIGIGFSLTQINSIVEEFRSINQTIQSAVAGLGDVAEAQKSILEAANESRVSYESMASTVSDLVQASSDLFPVEDAVNFSSTVTKLLKTYGRSDEEISSMLESMSKSFQQGAIQTDTLNKMLESCPEAANVLAESLGTTKDQLSELVSDGLISCQQLKDAFLNAADEIDGAFDDMDLSISEALTSVRNSWGYMLADIDETLGITDTIAKTIVRVSNQVLSAIEKIRTRIQWLSDKLGGVDNLFRLIAIAAGAAFAVFNFSKITSGLSSVSKLLSSINLKTLAIIAVIVLLALLIEDFFAFMKGEDSLIGTLLEKAGVDVDKFRENIIKIWENIKTILSAIWEGIKNVAIPVFQGIWSAIKSVFESIGNIIQSVAPQLAEFIDNLANGEIDTAQWVEVGEVIAKIALAIVAAIAVVKTVITVVKTVTTAVSAASSVIAFLTSPIGLVVVAIAALIAIGVALYKNWDTIKEYATSIWASIKTVATTIFTALQNFWAEHGEQIKNALVNAWTTIQNLLSAAWNLISTLAISIFNGLQEFWETWGSTITTAMSDAWEVIKAIFSTAFNVITDLFAVFSALFSGDWGALWESVKQLVSDIFGGISDIVSTILTAVWNVVSSIFSSIWEFISGVAENIWNAITTAFTNILTGITTTVTNIKETIVNGFTTAIDWIKSLPAQAIQWGADIIQGIVDGITGAIGKVGEAVSAVADKIKSFLGFSVPEDGPLSDFDTYMPDMIDLMSEGITASKEKVRDALEGLTDEMSVIASANLVSSGTATTASGTSQISKSVVLNSNINNTFNGDQAIQQQAAGTMDRSARDVTAELARGLAYAR